MKRLFTILASTALLCATSVASAGDSPFNPEDSDYSKWAPVLVDDDVMPSRGSVEAVKSWIDRAFGRQNESSRPTDDSILIEVERQDYSRLRFNETCIGETFIFPNDQTYSKGLGTHAQSRLRLVFPEPIAYFSAKVGINKTQPLGSARFRIDDPETTRLVTETIKGGDPALEIEQGFDPPVSEIFLITDNAGDGPNCDQANWIEPIAKTRDGKVYDVAEKGIVSRFHNDVPFSFKYDGKSSRDFLDKWTFAKKALDSTRDVYSWTDPDTKLTVSATVRRFEKFAAVDWTLNFKNEGTSDSGLIEDVQVLDAGFDYGFERTDLAIHTLNGDFCNETSWFPIVKTVKPGETETFSPVGGRSSNGAFPFWNLTSKRYSDSEQSEGLFVALGWSGQWKTSFENVPSAVSQTNVRAGMEEIATILYPDEEIRSPRVLLMPWRSDRPTAQVLFRRLLMFEYAPKVDGKPVKMETIAQCFDRYYRKRPGWEHCDAQIKSAEMLKDIGGSAYWFDAAWFPVGFPNGVGNWRSAPEFFPNGVEELGDALEKIGLRFILWFEPERVAKDSDIANDYPQYVFGGENGGLYKLNDPEARQYLTELLLKRIKEFKIGVYRNDFNIDPLPFWRANDEENRKRELAAPESMLTR